MTLIILVAFAKIACFTLTLTPYQKTKTRRLEKTVFGNIYATLITFSSHFGEKAL